MPLSILIYILVTYLMFALLDDGIIAPVYLVQLKVFYCNLFIFINANINPSVYIYNAAY